MYEKSDRLGGVFVAAAAPSFKEKDKQLIKWYENEMKRLNITIHFNTEVKNLSEIVADEYVIATGAKAKLVPIKGIEKAIEAIDYLNGKETKENVIVIGGGLTGCEIAYDLYLQGKKPTIVEMKDDLIAVKGICLANTSFLRDFFATNKVPVYLETKLGEVLEDGVIAIDKTGNSFKINADSVILSVGYNPAPLAPKGKHVHIVGDAKKVGNLRTVIWNAWDVAMKL